MKVILVMWLCNKVIVLVSHATYRCWPCYSNKVIRPKSRASALSKNVRQTDRQTIFFFKKTFQTAIYYSEVLLHYSET